ncbi:class I SAM-dependent methyltransferase [Pseudonocardia sp. GCM10023141]|uniref:class I SAM-dependent methyltransferase n=1 Tax=Pseudonocardia sp. GCM10023141 TaxID=3252653 RepID=UPI003613EAE0
MGAVDRETPSRGHARTVAAATDAQLVLLGAGFDSRAHRLPRLRVVPVFEVDHPATQATERELIGRSGRVLAPVRYVPVDFETDDLETALLRAGLRPERRTCFVWEGVTNYLTAAAVDTTLAILRRLAPAGGTLVMTYVHAGVLDGSVRFPGSQRWLRNVARLGEPWAESLHDPRLAASVAEGFTRVLLALIQGLILQQAFEPGTTSSAYGPTVLRMLESLLRPES